MILALYSKIPFPNREQLRQYETSWDSKHLEDNSEY